MNHIVDLTLSVSPVIEPLTLTEVKNYLRVGVSDDDTLITSLIKSVRYSAEQYLRKSLITQSWKASLDKYAPSIIELPMGPVQQVSSVKTIAKSGLETFLDNSLYYQKANKNFIEFETTPISHRIEITYDAGYGDTAESIPDPIKSGILMHISDIYDGRAGASNIPSHTIELYRPFKNICI